MIDNIYLSVDIWELRMNLFAYNWPPFTSKGSHFCYSKCTVSITLGHMLRNLTFQAKILY